MRKCIGNYSTCEHISFKVILSLLLEYNQFSKLFMFILKIYIIHDVKSSIILVPQKVAWLGSPSFPVYWHGKAAAPLQEHSYSHPVH